MRSLSLVRPFLVSSLLALTACSSDTTASSGSTTIVSIQNFYFYPFTVAVRVGASVEWTNYDPVSHTTTSDLGLWDSGALSPVAPGSACGRLLPLHVHAAGHLRLPLQHSSAELLSRLCGHRRGQALVSLGQSRGCSKPSETAGAGSPTLAIAARAPLAPAQGATPP